MQLTPAQARSVDPVLTTAARGFKHDDRVAPLLFPEVRVGARGGRIVTFGREDFRLYNTRRAPGARTARVQFGYLGAPYSLNDDSLEGAVPFEIMEDANAVPGIDLGVVAVRKVDAVMSLGLEVQSANIARTAANYAPANRAALTGAVRWDQSTSTPVQDIIAAKEAIRSKIGVYPNLMVLSPKANLHLCEHAAIRDQFKYTSAESVTPEMLARKFDISRVAVGKSVYVNDAGAQLDVWGTDVILAYVDVTGLADMGSPSAFYTYRLNGYPAAEVPYQDRNAKSWIYPYTRVEAPVMAGANGDGAFLLQTVVS